MKTLRSVELFGNSQIVIGDRTGMRIQLLMLLFALPDTTALFSVIPTHVSHESQFSASHMFTKNIRE